MARSFRAQLTEAFKIIKAKIIAAKMQKAIHERACVTAAKHEPVAV